MADTKDERLPIRKGKFCCHCRINEFGSQKKRFRNRLDRHELVAVLCLQV
ncbi:MAG TPA: hypothetical protein VGP68_14685 [Gemmataceae bacterium]|nr:hypothetical protein [Gemmataceae bacterium]